MRISVCVGEYAKVPYRVAGLELSVYCMEELCFCIRENAFLIDLSLMNDGLVNWIGKDCGLTALARELYSMVHKKGSLSAFVTLILEYTGLYEPAVVREIEQVLKRGAGLSGIEKRKSQIDYLVGKKKYAAAIKGYGALLSVWEESEKSDRELPAPGVLAGILHNRGVAFCGLMLYARAAECFLHAFETEEDEEEFLAYLAAKRLELSEEAYIAFTAQLKGSYSAALKLESRLEEIKTDFLLQPEALRLSQRKDAWLQKDKELYREENRQMTEAMKDGYRMGMGE